MAAATQTGERVKDAYKNHPRSFNHNPNEQEIAWLNTQMPSPDPTILDVTAGGGSIPFEAGRLGFRTIANELNPVACHILRATCEWPQEYGYPLLDDYKEVSTRFQTRVSELMDGIYPDEQVPDCAGGKLPPSDSATAAPETAMTRQIVPTGKLATPSTLKYFPKGIPKHTFGLVPHVVQDAA